LGLEYDGKTLRASTRKGSTLVYDKKDLVNIYEARRREANNSKAGYMTINRKTVEDIKELVRSAI